jgi:DNA-binding NtrC family response regulator
MADILVVEDDQAVASAFEQFLRYEGHNFRVASNAGDAFRFIEERSPSLVIMDVRMPGMDGLQALERIRSRFPGIDVVIMTAYGTSQTSIDSIRGGAFDYLTKPLDLNQLRSVIEKSLAAQQSRDRAIASTADSVDAPVKPVLVGDSPSMVEVYKLIGRLVTTDVPALVTGERGTGKHLVISTIHENSARKGQPLVAIDCRALHESADDAAIVGQAGGTRHLMRIDALPPLLQARLALLLAGREPRVAADGQTAARVIASTDIDVIAEVRAGRFNRELYERLSVVTLRLPALRDRREDIPLLVRHFIQRFNAELNRTIKGVDETVAARLQADAWPGNVGELERAIKRACIVARSDVIVAEDLGDSLSEHRVGAVDRAESTLSQAARDALRECVVERREGAGSIFHEIVDVVEETLVAEALAITNGNQVKAADLLGVNRATLRKKRPD